MFINFKLYASAAMLLVSVFCARARCQDDLDSLLRILDARAHSVSTATWNYETVRLRGASTASLAQELSRAAGRVNNPMAIAHEKGLGSFVIDGKSSSSGSVMLDIKRSWYLLEIVEAHASSGGIAQERNVKFSYDGSVYVEMVSPTVRTVDRASTDDSAVQPPPFVEYATQTPTAATNAARLHSGGYNYITSRIPLIEGSFGSADLNASLLDFVKAVRLNRSEISFRVNAADDWVVSVPVVRGSTDFGVAQYSFNPQRGGCPVRVAWIQSSDWPATEEYLFENIEWKPGVFGPERVTWVQWLAGVGSRTTYLSVSIDSDLADESFAIKVPSGANVLDHARGMAYRSSGGPVDEAAATAQYATMNELRTGIASIDQRSWRILALFAFVASIGLLILVRRVRQNASSCVLIVSLGIGAVAGCKPNSESSLGVNAVNRDAFVAPDSLVWQDGWRLAFAGKAQDVHIAQCGFRTTVLALEMIGRHYDPVVIARSLPPTSLGIRMSDMKAVLEAHDVFVTARTDVMMRDILETISSDTLAIVFLPAYDGGKTRDAHYVIVAYDAKGELVYVDPPLLPVIASKVTDELHALNGLTVLLCKLPSPSKMQLTSNKREIEFSPSDFKGESLEGEISLYNSASTPVSVVGAQVPCTCITLDFHASIIPPNTAVTYRYGIDGIEWGYGKQTRTIKFTGASGGTLARVNFVGESISKSIVGVTSRMFVEKQFSIPLCCDAAPVRLSESLRLFEANSETIGTFSSATRDNWCSSTVRRRGNDIYLDIECEFDESRFADISSGLPCKTLIEVSLEGESLPVYDIALSFKRELNFRYVTTDTQALSAAVSVLITASPPSDFDIEAWELDSIQFESNLVEVDVERISGTEWRALVSSARRPGRPIVGRATFSHAMHPSVSHPILVTLRQ